MKTQFGKIVAQLTNMKERAEELADSENEKTIEKYENIPDFIDMAIDAIEEAIEALDR